MDLSVGYGRFWFTFSQITEENKQSVFDENPEVRLWIVPGNFEYLPHEEKMGFFVSYPVHLVHVYIYVLRDNLRIARNKKPAL